MKLSAQLCSYMITQLTWNQTAQTLLPWLWDKYKRTKHDRQLKKLVQWETHQQLRQQVDRSSTLPSSRVRHSDNDKHGHHRTDDTSLFISIHRIQQERSSVWREHEQAVYDPFDDYTELMIQYGYVVFFSAAFPLVPLLALLNNLIEVRSDAFKLCFLARRPKAEQVFINHP